MKDWKKKGIILFLLASLLLTNVACGKKTEGDDKGGIEIEEIEETEEVVQPVEPEITGVPSPLSGIRVPEEKLNKRPMAIIFDNQTGARPQAGLIDAEIAYEFLAEGNITRYLGIFLINEPEVIGSIRSARPYFIEKALEFDAYFVHVGGSDQAFADIVHKKVSDIDAMSRGNDVFWRKNHKKMPHNMYSSYDALKKATEKSKYRTEPTLRGFQFHSDVEVFQDGEIAKEIFIKYSKGYEPSYIYDEENKVYNRNYNGAAHKDETTGENLTATNIIVQEIKSKVIDEKLRLDMNTVGEGSGKYISAGKVKDITWKKGSYEGATKYFDTDGKELTLNPGKTWVQVVPNFNNVTIN
ncbi:DUF3048 domain-containing protein [Alkaliphilus oremlandii]|uniref:Lipoprotein YerB n=1 Tax=Alkaliphilus oremlandii (strain OhILAs) TaxID=350688 RepID=A8MG68_ALKOO|nr:DUF3048 domain-containing protein [Alkaliphilus oremlandii]ABW18796.1 conserved hypothetical protein [Alkaliphilus oremlandii OhILAs]